MKHVKLFLLLSITLVVCSCSNTDDAIEFDNRILGKWSIKNHSKDSFYEFDSPAQGRIIYRDWNGKEVVKGINDTVYLSKIEFTKSMKSHELKLTALNGNVYSNYIEKLDTDSVVFSSASGLQTYYRVRLD